MPNALSVIIKIILSCFFFSFSHWVDFPWLVSNVTQILNSLRSWHSAQINENRVLFVHIAILNLLVSICYSMKPDFSSFSTFCMSLLSCDFSLMCLSENLLLLSSLSLILSASVLLPLCLLPSLVSLCVSYLGLSVLQCGDWCLS